MSVCTPCAEYGKHWLCNLALLVPCDCEDPSHDNRPDPPRSILGERE